MTTLPIDCSGSRHGFMPGRLYIYICILHASVCDPAFHTFCIHQIEDFQQQQQQKKNWKGLTYLFFVRRVVVICVYVCLSLCTNKCEYVCVCAVARLYICTGVWVCTSMHFYIYTHISSVCWLEGVNWRKRECEEKSRWVGKWIVAIRISFSFLTFWELKFYLMWIWIVCFAVNLDYTYGCL